MIFRWVYLNKVCVCSVTARVEVVIYFLESFIFKRGFVVPYITFLQLYKCPTFYVPKLWRSFTSLHSVDLECNSFMVVTHTFLFHFYQSRLWLQKAMWQSGLYRQQASYRYISIPVLELICVFILNRF